MVVFNANQRNNLSAYQAAFGIFLAAILHRRLILRLAKREIIAKYKGSLLGMIWAVLNPLLLLFVYTFVFSQVFHMRWRVADDDSTGQFALLVFSGIILYNIFAECVQRAPSMMLENISYIKKVVFPLEILPYVQMVVALFGAVVAFLVLAAIYPFVFGWPPLTALMLPILLVPLVLLIMGLSWFLASLGVFLRDVRQVIGILVTVVMFMSPIFYPVEAVPEAYRPLLAIGPLAVPLEQVKAALFWGQMPDWQWLLGSGLVGWLAAACGYWWFMRTRRAFADVV